MIILQEVLLNDFNQLSCGLHENDDLCSPRQILSLPCAALRNPQLTRSPWGDPEFDMPAVAYGGLTQDKCAGKHNQNFAAEEVSVGHIARHRTVYEHQRSIAFLCEQPCLVDQKLWVVTVVSLLHIPYACLRCTYKTKANISLLQLLIQTSFVTFVHNQFTWPLSFTPKFIVYTTTN